MVGHALASPSTPPTTKLHPDLFGVGAHVAVCPADPTVVAYVGSDESGGYEARAGISRNGGVSFEPFPSLFAHANNGNIAFSATDCQRMVWAPLSASYSPQGAGLVPHLTTNGGTTWQPAVGAPTDINPLEQFWFGSQALVGDGVDGLRFYLYHWGNLYVSTDGNAGQTWEALQARSLPVGQVTHLWPDPREEAVWVGTGGRGVFFGKRL